MHATKKLNSIIISLIVIAVTLVTLLISSFFSHPARWDKCHHENGLIDNDQKQTGQAEKQTVENGDNNIIIGPTVNNTINNTTFITTSRTAAPTAVPAQALTPLQPLQPLQQQVLVPLQPLPQAGFYEQQFPRRGVVLNIDLFGNDNYRRYQQHYYNIPQRPHRVCRNVW